MKLKVKDVDLSTGGPVIAILNEKDAKAMGINAAERVSVSRLKKKNQIVAVADIATSGIKPGEVGLFEEPLKQLGIKGGVRVDIGLSARPISVKHISEKLNSVELSEKKINEIIDDIMNNRLSEVEMAYFVSACYTEGLSMKETAALTNAIVYSGSVLGLKKKVIIDKHCVGGVPNNRTTPIVVPLLASLGYTMPKTSSRSITSPAGTADTVEVVAPVSLTLKKLKEVVAKTNACMVWGGSINLAAADDKLIRIRHPLSIDPEGMLLASILAKKKAVGATHVIIDIPCGYMAKFSSKKKAENLASKFVALGKMLGMKIKVVITDGSQPIGNGIGPAMEMVDVISVLKGNGPTDLREKAVYIAVEMLKIVNEKNAEQKVLDALDSGRAYEKFMEIVVAQGGRKHICIPKARNFHDIKAPKDGAVSLINNKGVAVIAKFAGAPEDKAAGIYLRVHKGDKVKKGEVLFTIYSKSKMKLNSAIDTTNCVEHVVVK
uniref:AMP phosphorylase n=1 Tax=uncultured Candidatus Pacearchaeota archaeon TaxID=2109283 RepID=A0A447ITZ2_9ARCH|nr:AMP phosphorylase [uncultured Candidatus Pacearchaeota archaeon]